MEVVILAAGKGTRMHSAHPKVMHDIGGKPMLAHVVATAQRLQPEKVHVVVGFGAETIKLAFESFPLQVAINWVSQSEQLGTGHAVQQALPQIDVGAADNPVLVLFGDVPLIKAGTLQAVLTHCNRDSVSLLTVNTQKPEGLGRIIRNDENQVTAIIEERDASAEQKQIKEVNSGIMAIPAARLERWLGSLQNNNDQQEYYLTDIVSMAAQEGCNINASVIDDDMEVMGVNDKHQLALLERHYQMTTVEKLLSEGVTVRDPARLDIRGDVSCGKDTIIDCNVILEGSVSLGSNVEIGANAVIKDSVLGDGVKVLPGTQIEGSTIGNGASIGPMARLRPGTELGEETKIGNFVETKNAKIGKGSKASHLAYLGDVELGENCNIGAGAIVCNYDGVNKHKTTLGDNVFVGSNSVLVAPVVLEDNAFVAAGSAINSAVPADSLAVARSKQRNISGWKRPAKNK
ncbi:MAG: bifunctional UDP-N-acetylglucosamine diphosphorylase/glucosamine-1-phosphate N-acetyltransferase GlmU [Pseudomonadales bacterium]|nr:bifunctional UDP-N-acetylglucosamine diphosphorylase/glucosamine-1-phosphate N-acetyltransferase GlmU [Pseudomonadales bacterium]